MLISAPTDKYLGSALNPSRYAVPNAGDNPVRALVFDKNPVSSVVFRVDGGAWLPMQPAAGRAAVWQASWDASRLAVGQHLIEVQASSVSGTSSDTIAVDVEGGAACNQNGRCEEGENCSTCSQDCPGSTGTAACGNGRCEPAAGEDCLSCAADCAGLQNAKPGKRFCCGDGDGEGPVGCADPRCQAAGFSCGAVPPSFCCGNAVCETGEDGCGCTLDCGQPPLSETVLVCDDGADNDCDGAADCGDTDCAGTAACQCGAAGARCLAAAECCSGICRKKVCR